MRKADVDSEDLLVRLSQRMKGGDVDGAIALCDSTPGPVGDTLGAGLRKLQLLERIGKGPEEIEDGIVAAMEERGLHVVNYLERNLTTLATMASLAPILGMMGTVIGMIKAFGNIKLMAAMTPAAVAGGIGEALWCTAGGLIVAAMTTVEYNYFTARVNRFALQVQAAATKMVDRLLHDQSSARLGRKEATA
jgi:biopolymer transport protein ExbB